MDTMKKFTDNLTILFMKKKKIHKEKKKLKKK